MAIVFQTGSELNKALADAGKSIGGAISDISKKRTEKAKTDAFQTKLKEVLDAGGDPMDFIEQEVIKGTIPEKSLKGIETVYGPQFKERAKTRELQNQFPELFGPKGGTGQPGQPGDQEQMSPEQMDQETDPNRASMNTHYNLMDADDQLLEKMHLNSTTKPLAQFHEKRKERAQKAWEEDRKYSAGETKDYKKQMTSKREKQENVDYWLPMARNAVVEGDTSWFSGTNFANLTGIKAFETKEGALLQSAAKNYLVGTLTGVKGRPNQFLEQTILSSFPQIGQSQEVNEMVLLGLEGEAEMNKAHLKAYDEMAAKDIAETSQGGREGYVKPDIESRVDKVFNERATEIRDKTAYRMKKLKERGKKLSDLVDEKVIAGTPATPRVAAAYMKKYGSREKAEKVMKKRGFRILSEDQIRQWEGME